VRVYLDTSALVKLLVAEAESDALRTYLAEQASSRRVASGLVRTELRRAALRVDETLLPAVDRLLSSLALVRVDDPLLDAAGTLGPAVVRSLDAIHLASALRVAPLTGLVTYDEPMQAAARSLGVPVAAPGA
jgi:predicted nucleic acid-binding protein